MFDETGQPTSHPLKTWDEVVNWKPSDAELFKEVVKLSNTCALPKRRRTLVCHDMAGGYLHDRYIGLWPYHRNIQRNIYKFRSTFMCTLFDNSRKW